MLIDTDVLIWYMRGNKKAKKVVEGNPGFFISVVTYIELVQGLRNKDEWNELQKAIRSWEATVLHINEKISSKSQFYIDNYFLSHSIRLAYSLIPVYSPRNLIVHKAKKKGRRKRYLCTLSTSFLLQRSARTNFAVAC